MNLPVLHHFFTVSHPFFGDTLYVYALFNVPSIYNYIYHTHPQSPHTPSIYHKSTEYTLNLSFISTHIPSIYHKSTEYTFYLSFISTHIPSIYHNDCFSIVLNLHYIMGDFQPCPPYVWNHKKYQIQLSNYDIIDFNPVFLVIVASHIRPRAMIIASFISMLRISVKDCDHRSHSLSLMCEATMTANTGLSSLHLPTLHLPHRPSTILSYFFPLSSMCNDFYLCNKTHLINQMQIVLSGVVWYKNSFPRDPAWWNW